MSRPARAGPPTGAAMKVCALAGGVGGAKLASGLQDVLPPGISR